jgi:hypothetical protein
MPKKAEKVVEHLASTQRVIFLGGIAVIAHGLSRVTEDSDIWLDPGSSLGEWCDRLRAVLPSDSGLFDVSRHDISFLERKLREEISSALMRCSAAEARGLFSRYLDHATAEVALQSPDPAVRTLGLDGLRELAEGGNPCAIAALKRLDFPGLISDHSF